MMEQAGGFFNEGRLALMKGTHLSEHAPLPGGRYALLLDVAGEDAGLSAVSRHCFRNFISVNYKTALLSVQLFYLLRAV